MTENQGVEASKAKSDNYMVRSSMNHMIEQMLAFDQKFNRYQQAARLFEELEELEGLALCCLKIGNILFDRGDYKGALEAYQRGRQAARQVGAEMINANCLLKIGLIFEHGKEPVRALNYFQTALKHFQQHLDEKGIAHCVQKIEVCATKLKWGPVDR